MANNYDSEALNEICSQIDLYEYASENYDFEKRGLDNRTGAVLVSRDRKITQINLAA